MKSKIWYVFLCCLLTLPAQAGTFDELAKLTASDGAAFDAFGFTVAVDGDTAIVGASRAAANASAYVFVRDGAVWTEEAKLTASDGAARDFFGSVAFVGDTAVVGAPNHDDNGSNSGSAYVFVRVGGAWSEQAKLTALDGAVGDKFGFSVAFDGDTAVVGARLDDDNGFADSGSAYVFTRVGAIWSQAAKLTASDATQGDQFDDFGFRVAVDGDTVVVGARFDDDNGTDSGSAYVFVRVGGAWSEQAKLTALDGAAGDEFGYSVALDGDTAVVGARRDDDNGFADSGSAYVFTRDGAIWSQAAKLTASNGTQGDQFGFSVALEGDTAVVGASFDNEDDRSPPRDPTTNSGSAYVFTRVGAIWSQAAHLTASDAAQGDQFGFSVALDGDTVVVSAIHDDDNGSRSGSAYVFGPNPVIGAIEALVAKVVGLNLQQGIENALDTKLETAIGALDDVNQNNNTSGINRIVAFMNEVEAQRGSTLTEAQADDLLADAQAILDLL